MIGPKLIVQTIPVAIDASRGICWIHSSVLPTGARSYLVLISKMFITPE